MSDYISRQAAIKAINNAFVSGHLVLNAVKDIPAADVVEVVRCKDCFIHDVCKAVEWYGENGFCCIGERKDD